jgi:hypothetical protein
MANIPATFALSSGSESMWSDCAAPMEKPPVRVRVRECVGVGVGAGVAWARACGKAATAVRSVSMFGQTHHTQCG